MNEDTLRPILRAKLNAYTMSDEEFDDLIANKGQEMFIRLIEEYTNTLSTEELERFAQVMESNDFNVINEFIITHGDIASVDIKSIYNNLK